MDKISGKEVIELDLSLLGKSKNAQVTLFVILSLLLVVAIGILFYYWRPGILFQDDLQPRLESCISSSIDENVKALALNAGVLEPRFSYIYDGKNHTYLCYTEDLYRPCVNQEPMISRVFEDSLVVLLEEEFQDCYDSSFADLRRRGYDVDQGEATFNLSIDPQGISIIIDAPMTVSTEDTSVRTQRYSYVHSTNLYELLMVATSLVQFETFYGDSEQTIQMRLYPDIHIDKRRQGDQTKVYILTERNENIEYRFAVRSFPRPVGGLV